MFIENGEISRSEASQNVKIKEVSVQVPIASISSSRVIVPYVVETHNNQEEQQINDHEVNNELVVEQP